MTTRITIPLAGAPAVIAESVRAVLKAHGLELLHYGGIAGPRTLNEERMDALCLEIGINAAQGLVGLDEAPPEPCRHVLTVVDFASGDEECRECERVVARRGQVAL